MTRILVVDDQPDIRDLLRAILEVRGYDIDEASSGRDALGMLDRVDRFDLIVLDVQMSQMDGWEVLASIREHFGEFGPRVLLCTVKGHPRDLIRGWTAGCDGYVWKPFDVKAILSEVDAVLKRTAADRPRVRRSAIEVAEHMLRAVG